MPTLMSKKELKAIMGTLIINETAEFLSALQAATSTLMDITSMKQEEAEMFMNDVLEDIKVSYDTMADQVEKYRAKGLTVEDLQRDIETELKSNGVDVDSMRNLFDRLN